MARVIAERGAENRKANRGGDGEGLASGTATAARCIGQENSERGPEAYRGSGGAADERAGTGSAQHGRGRDPLDRPPRYPHEHLIEAGDPATIHEQTRVAQEQRLVADAA